MDCSTIIVSYNTFELTAGAIRSAARSAAAMDHEVIVVDNASPDQSASRLAELFRESDIPITLIANEHNPGFAAANNQGAAEASGRVLFFLNPDTVVHDDAIPRLCSFLENHQEVGAVGPLVLNTDGSIQPSTFKLISAREIVRQHLPLGSLLLGRDRRMDPVPTSSSPVDVVKGCALAIRRSTFDQIGGWNETYFMYAEETEMCYQLLQAGYKNYFLREARITHFGGAASLERYAEQQVIHQRSTIQFLRRHHGRAMLALHRWTGYFGFALRTWFFALRRRLRPERADDYQLREEAARTLARWFKNDYS